MGADRDLCAHLARQGEQDQRRDHSAEKHDGRTRPQMNRRNLMKAIGAGAVTSLVGKKEAAAQNTVERAGRGMKSPIIKDVSVIATAPAGLRLCVVKITTDQDGLYGYGCATFTQRAALVVPAVEKYLKPFLIGKPADRIDDTWQACYNSSYWRNGPVLNNAISGVRSEEHTSELQSRLHLVCR